MGIGAELKEFVAAFQAGYKLSSDSIYQKHKMEQDKITSKMQERQLDQADRGLDYEMDRIRQGDEELAARKDGSYYDRRSREGDDGFGEAFEDFERRENGGAIPEDANVVKTSFMNTVGRKVTNPYALATVAAYGQHESGFDPKNAARTWQDGKYKSGGVMSWNGPRYEKMLAFTGGDLSPEMQGAFFLEENPELINRLNNAKSVEEANRMMADAWRFVGYDGGPEYHARERTARQLVGKLGDTTAIPEDV